MNRSTVVALVVSVGALGSALSGIAARVETTAGSPRLTSTVPRFVTQICASGRLRSPLPLVCPPLVPVSKYRAFAGLSGVLLGNTKLPPVNWPSWVMPRSRPHGKRAWLWLLHVGFIIASTFSALTMFWLILPGVWRWVVLGIYVYSAVITPFALRQMLRTYWNAPEAAEKNRELAVGQH